MERDHGHSKQQRPPRSCSCSLSLLAGFSRPPPPPRRSPYTCGFCKREFSLSQALGGHMNVHRWDRAMLIHCSLHHLPPPPNPNPSRGADLAPGLKALNSSPPRREAVDDGDSAGADEQPVFYSFFSTASSSGATTKGALEANMPELGAVACSTGGGMEDDLDLELRLAALENY